MSHAPFIRHHPLLSNIVSLYNISTTRLHQSYVRGFTACIFNFRCSTSTSKLDATGITLSERTLLREQVARPILFISAACRCDDEAARVRSWLHETSGLPPARRAAISQLAASHSHPQQQLWRTSTRPVASMNIEAGISALILVFVLVGAAYDVELSYESRALHSRKYRCVRTCCRCLSTRS